MNYLDMAAVGKHATRLEIKNGTNRPRAVWVELWGHDYTLLPLESIELITWGKIEPPEVSVEEHADATAIVLSPSARDGLTFGDHVIHKDGVLLKPGYQRREGLEAGLTY